LVSAAIAATRIWLARKDWRGNDLRGKGSDAEDEIFPGEKISSIYIFSNSAIQQFSNSAIQQFSNATTQAG